MRLPSHEFPDGFSEWLQPLFDARGRLISGLSNAERWVCRTTVHHFLDAGSGPSLESLCSDGSHPREEVEAALAHLDERDFLVIEGERVVSFYPFSGRPCRHRVVMEGRPRYAM